MKTIADNQAKLEKLEERLYKATVDSAVAYGAINTLLQIQSGKHNILPPQNKEDGNENIK